MVNMWRAIAGVEGAVLVLMTAGPATAGFITFSAGGDATPASIQSTVDAFRAALGEPNNGNAPGPLPSGRREINWDGGGVLATSPAPTPFTGFQNIRGAAFATPGTGFVQATPAGLATDVFANPTYADIFSAFSPSRLFTPVGSNITDVVFFIPGTGGAVPATVGGFGSVFTDVDLLDTTRLEFFDASDVLLFSGFAPPGAVADGSHSFFGAVADAGEQVFRVRITTGTGPLGPDDNPSAGVDMVVMDDHLYREPTAVVPEPATLTLLTIGFLAALGARPWRRRRRDRQSA